MKKRVLLVVAAMSLLVAVGLTGCGGTTVATVLAQMSSHQLEQTGFAAAADAGHDLDRLCVLKGDELV